LEIADICVAATSKHIRYRRLTAGYRAINLAVPALRTG
jgi:hypothetical protein